METLALTSAIPLLLALLSISPCKLTLIKSVVPSALWIHFCLIAWLCWPVITETIPEIRISQGLALSHLGALFLLLTIFVAASALTHAKFFFDKEESRTAAPAPRHVAIFYACSNLFLLAMCWVFFCDNLGYLWIAIEATTLTSAPLVYFGRTRHALEATWKYLIICSVGIAFALLGTVFIFASSQHGAIAGGSLVISELIHNGSQLQYSLMRLGFIFCLLGYGTKAGLFPLHSWLPDAHAEAPAPASALLSGSLLNCALFGIWRVNEIMVSTRHNLISHDLIVWLGTITVLAASIFLVRQHGFKRLWAYSSIENVGIMLVAIGLGSGALFFLQALNHSIAKVSLFLLSGNIVQSTGSKSLGEIRGVIKFAPVWGLLLALSAFAVTGAPPFGAFLSEWLILTSAADAANWAVVITLILGLTLSFVAVSNHLVKVLFGNPKPSYAYFQPILTSLLPACLVACSLVLGFTTGYEVFKAVQ
ncbi:MAG: NADH dehydrogenase FAD-containing subunit [Candidatus Melainabacteria bacterium]|nr:NADH dehydrogenase FAD-containing subunit [Candidatus Melainabacteria bacterium]